MTFNLVQNEPIESWRLQTKHVFPFEPKVWVKTYKQKYLRSTPEKPGESVRGVERPLKKNLINLLLVREPLSWKIRSQRRQIADLYRHTSFVYRKNSLIKFQIMIRSIYYNFQKWKSDLFFKYIMNGIHLLNNIFKFNMIEEI